LELRLQLIGVAVVAGVALIAVLQHHTGGSSNGGDGGGGSNAGYIGLAVSYALGITAKVFNS